MFGRQRGARRTVAVHVFGVRGRVPVGFNDADKARARGFSLKREQAGGAALRLWGRTLFVGLVAASLLVGATSKALAAPPPPSGTVIYKLNKEVHRDAVWRLTVTTVVVTELFTQVNVRYENLSASPAALFCPAVNENYLIAE